MKSIEFVNIQFRLFAIDDKQCTETDKGAPRISFKEDNNLTRQDCAFNYKRFPDLFILGSLHGTKRALKLNSSCHKKVTELFSR